MEHASDPLIALEIAMDHLREKADYYSSCENPDDSAQMNAAEEANDNDVEFNSTEQEVYNTEQPNQF